MQTPPPKSNARSRVQPVLSSDSDNDDDKKKDTKPSAAARRARSVHADIMAAYTEATAAMPLPAPPGTDPLSLPLFGGGGGGGAAAAVQAAVDQVWSGLPLSVHLMHPVHGGGGGGGGSSAVAAEPPALAQNPADAEPDDMKQVRAGVEMRQRVERRCNALQGERRRETEAYICLAIGEERGARVIAMCDEELNNMLDLADDYLAMRDADPESKDLPSVEEHYDAKKKRVKRKRDDAPPVPKAEPPAVAAAAAAAAPLPPAEDDDEGEETDDDTQIERGTPVIAKIIGDVHNGRFDEKTDLKHQLEDIAARHLAEISSPGGGTIEQVRGCIERFVWHSEAIGVNILTRLAAQDMLDFFTYRIQLGPKVMGMKPSGVNPFAPKPNPKSTVAASAAASAAAAAAPAPAVAADSKSAAMADAGDSDAATGEDDDPISDDDEAEEHAASPASKRQKRNAAPLPDHVEL